MAVVKEKTFRPEKVNMLSEYDDAMQRVIKQDRVEIDNLKHERELLTLKNRQLDEELDRKKGLYDQYVRVEKQKLQEFKSKTNNDEIARMYKLEQAEQTMLRREEEMQRREALGMKIVEERNKINNDRIQIEKLKSSASQQIDEASRKMSEAISLFDRANIFDKQAKDNLSKSNAINSTLNKRENELLEKEKSINESLNNLKEIKEVVDPKIKEIKLIEENIDKKTKELQDKEEKVTHDIYEERELLKAVEIAQAKLKERERQLNQKEEEITRKALFNKVDV